MYKIKVKSWFEIKPKEESLSFYGDWKRFESERLAKKYLSRDNYMHPELYEVIEVERVLKG